MNKITYFGDNQKTDFAFSFNFFQKSDIQIEINGKPQISGYTLTCVESTKPADIPYLGGTISFAQALKSNDMITIYRKIELGRIVDYQPTEKIDPELLNQDFNYLIEVIKDCDTAISDFSEKYAELSKLPQVTQLNKKLDNIQTDLDALGDFNNIAQKSEITALQNGTSFSATGKDNIVNLTTPQYTAGAAINTNFIGNTIGDYTYEIPKSGFIGMAFSAGGNNSMLAIQVNAVQIMHFTLLPNQKLPFLFPVNKGDSLMVSIRSNDLLEVTHQRLFAIKGAQ